MIDVEGIYNQYLDHLNTEADKEWAENKGSFRASSAGQCFRKQAYWLSDKIKKPFDDRVKRLLRLGQIIHSDVEDALNWYYKQLKDKSKTIFTEHKIELPKLNVVNYELQLGTYALGLSQQLKIEPTKLYLTWYNKDNSTMKSVEVPIEYMDKAQKYWESLITKLNIVNLDPERIIPKEDKNTPVYQWECKYCNFSNICPSPYK